MKRDIDCIVQKAKTELKNISFAIDGKNHRTGDVRQISAKLYKEIKNESIEVVFSICDALLEQREWALGIIAYDFAFRMRKYYDENTFSIFEGWLEKYVRGWGDCDDFCTHAFGELICQNTKLVDNIITWTERDEFWMRRAAAVILIPSIWKDKYTETNPLGISDILMRDEHHLVLKGYGWMLKILSTKEPELVFEYLMKNKAIMPRVSYRYALEKMDAEKKLILMR